MYKYLKFKMYQTEWNGISLNTIANKLGLSSDDVVAEDFYDEFYIRLRNNKYSLSDEWITQKKITGKLLKSVCDNYADKVKYSPKILSIGAGTGIVEEEMIREGYDIELQECQGASFDYIKRRGVSIKKEWITMDFSILPDDTYDIVYIGVVMYSLSDDIYMNILNNCNRILKKHGKLVIWDAGCPLRSAVYAVVKKIIRKNTKGVLWGWIRNPKVHIHNAKSAGFNCIKNIVYDEKFNEIDIVKILGYGLRNKGYSEWFEYVKL